MPFPTLEDPPNSGIEPESLMSPSLAGGFFTTSHLGSPYSVHAIVFFAFFSGQSDAPINFKMMLQHLITYCKLNSLSLSFLLSDFFLQGVTLKTQKEVNDLL